MSILPADPVVLVEAFKAMEQEDLQLPTIDAALECHYEQDGNFTGKRTYHIPEVPSTQCVKDLSLTTPVQVTLDVASQGEWCKECLASSSGKFAAVNKILSAVAALRGPSPTLEVVEAALINLERYPQTPIGWARARNRAKVEAFRLLAVRSVERDPVAAKAKAFNGLVHWRSKRLFDITPNAQHLYKLLGDTNAEEDLSARLLHVLATSFDAGESSQQCRHTLQQVVDESLPGAPTLFSQLSGVPTEGIDLNAPDSAEAVATSWRAHVRGMLSMVFEEWEDFLTHLDAAPDTLACLRLSSKTLHDEMSTQMLLAACWPSRERDGFTIFHVPAGIAQLLASSEVEQHAFPYEETFSDDLAEAFFALWEPSGGTLTHARDAFEAAVLTKR